MNPTVHTPSGRPAGVYSGGFFIPDFYHRYIEPLRAMALEPIGDIADISLTETSPFLISVIDWDVHTIGDFSGDTGQHSINTNPPVLIGNNSLKYDDISATGEHIYATSGLTFPGQGDLFRVYHYADSAGTSTNVANYQFGVQSGDPTNNYHIYIDNRSGRSNMFLYRDNYGTELASSQTNIVIGFEWVEHTLRWETDGTITAKTYEIDQTDASRVQEVRSLTHTDTTYTSGGVGFLRGGAGDDGSVWDNMDIIGSA